MKYNEKIDILPARLRMTEKAFIKDFDLIDLKEPFNNVFRKYQIVIIDCPPALNAFSTMALLLAQYVLIPFVPEPFAYDGLASMLEALNKVIVYNQNFIDYRILYSRVKGQKTIIHENYSAAVRDQMSDKVFTNIIPDFIGIVERGEVRKNIFTSNSSEKAVQKIEETCNEIDQYIFEGRK
jgi:chromosome partitioning protein